MKKVVFLDRDGTIIIDKIYLNDPEGVEYLEGVFEGMNALQEAGFEFIIVTNQSGVPRGLVSLENLEQIHKNIESDLKQKGIQVLAFYYAAHSVDSNHPLRKPNPGMLDQGVEEFGVDRSKSWMVGDRMTDVEAGHRAQMKSIFMNGTEKHTDSEFNPPEFVAENFSQVAKFILENS